MDPNWIVAALTGVSVIVAGYAVRHARRATEAANKAVTEAKEANRHAREANQIAERSNAIAATAGREAATEAAWDAYITALAAVQNYDPTDDQSDVGPHLTAMRTRATLLIDKIDWPGFDKWVVQEQTLGALLMREAADNGRRDRARLGRYLTPAETLENNAHFHTWVAGFTINVRFARKRFGVAPIEELTANARQGIEVVCDRNGWDLPADKVPGLEPLPSPE